MKDGGRQASHEYDAQLAGSRKPRRSRALVVLPPDEPVWMPKPGLPAGGRDECRNGERPCRYVRCRHHLWRLDGDRQGPHWRGPLATTLAPRWLEHPTPACCALDIADGVARGEQLDYVTIGKALGKTPDWTRRLIRRALKRLLTLMPKEIDEP